MVAGLEQKLAHFNRKERFLLVGQALGNPGFTVGAAFRRSLAALLDRPVPKDAYCAMDYHLDWLFAALLWAEGKVHPGPPCQAVVRHPGAPGSTVEGGDRRQFHE
jgi:hypothetical protein